MVVKNGCFFDAIVAILATELVACNGRLQRAVALRCDEMMLYTSSAIFLRKIVIFLEKNMNLELR